MGKKSEKKVKGAWKDVQAAIWLIGLGIIALNDWWWPGILFLIAMSMISQAVIQMMTPNTKESIRSIDETPPTEDKIMATSSQDSLKPAYSTHRLPTECPKCGAPIRGTDVSWSGPESADCPYCGANLPLH